MFANDLIFTVKLEAASPGLAGLVGSLVYRQRGV